VKRKLLVAAALVVGLGACAQQPEGPDLQPTVDRLEDELADTQQNLAEANAEAGRLQQDLAQLRRDLAQTTALAQRRGRTVALFEGCLQDIIDETNRIDFVYQYERALRTAFNGANCSALGYYWG